MEVVGPTPSSCVEQETLICTVFPGNPGDVFKKCLEEVQAISCATLFSPVTRQEAVQAMGKQGLSHSTMVGSSVLV